MSAEMTKNEGFRVLEDAIYVVGLRNSEVAGRAVPRGMTIADESIAQVGEIADFERYETDSLIAIVDEFGATLPPDKLCSIHTIALRRLGQDKGADPEKAVFLSQLVMRVAAQRVPA